MPGNGCTAFTGGMDEQERIYLTDLSERDRLGDNGFRASWHALQQFAVNTGLGRSGNGVRVRGVDHWVLHNELTR